MVFSEWQCIFLHSLDTYVDLVLAQLFYLMEHHSCFLFSAGIDSLETVSDAAAFPPLPALSTCFWTLLAQPSSSRQ